MDGSVPKPPGEASTASTLFERLEDFVEALGAQGLVVDAEQRVRLFGFLSQLAADGRLPDDPDRLCRLITPILAGSPAQQTTCETTFKAVFTGERKAPANKPGGEGADSADEERQKSWGVQFRLARGLIGGTLAVLAAVAVYLAILYGPFFRPPLHEQKATELPSYSTTIRALDIDWLRSYPIEELDPPRQSPWNRSWRWYYTEYSAAKWVALLLPWFMYLTFLSWLYHQLLAYLRREALKQNLRSLDWRLGDVNPRFGDRRLIGDLQPLRTLARAHLHVLDPERTALVSAESAGLLKPQFRSVAVPTDFVALIDRQSPRDHLAEYNMQVVRTLRDASLSVEVFEFDRDPTLCHIVRMGEFVRLDAVVHRFPDSIILLFAAAEQLLDPARHRLLPAVLALESARRIVLLTPESAGPETPLERQLAHRLGLAVLRTAPAGVGELVGRLLGISRRVGAKSPLEPGPHDSPSALADFLAERPERWMQKVKPRAEDRRQLRDLMRRVLGPRALRWLTATTVYPELRWPLTLSLKSAVGEPSWAPYALDGELLAVSRLPWFRRGWMPDWTRSLLQEALAEDDSDRARRVILESIGLHDRRRGRRGEDLEIRLADHPAVQTDRVRADRIMLEYLLPALRSSRRLLALPESWARRLARKPLRRLAAVAVIGVVVAAGASLGVLSLLPIDECDLLASSPFDDLRLGPGNDQKALEAFYAPKALTVCHGAVERKPGNGRYWYQLARVLSISHLGKSVDVNSRAIELNYPAAYNGLGVIYHLGEEGVGVDLEQAQRYYAKAVELGNTASLNNLAAITGARGDERSTYDLLRRYVDNGGRYTEKLALFYKDGRVVQQSIAKYIELLKLGVRRGDGSSARRLGFEYDKGDHVPRNRRRANELYEMAVRWTVDASAATNLGLNYLVGEGVERNLEKATYWFIFAAKLGRSRALVELSMLIQDGNAKFRPGYGPPGSLDPVLLLRIAAESGDARAQFKVAEIVEGAAKQRKEGASLPDAIAWYRKSAARGYQDAKEALKRLGVAETE